MVKWVSTILLSNIGPNNFKIIENIEGHRLGEGFLIGTCSGYDKEFTIIICV